MAASRERLARYRAHLLLGSIFILFLLLRLHCLSSNFTWDETRFFFILKDFIKGDPQVIFHGEYYIHPPLYLLACRSVFFFHDGSLTVCRTASLLFSSGSFFILYFLVKEVSGRTVALLSCLALAMLPAACSTDIWAREDAACVCFLLGALLLFIRRRYVWGGVLLGLCLLSKENGVFLLYFLAPYLVLAREKKEAWRGLVVMAAVAFLVGGWWYIFFSQTRGVWVTFYTGGNPTAVNWEFPWHFYISGTWTDVGGPLLIAALCGLIRQAWGFSRGVDRRQVLPVVWVIAFYLFFSISTGKPFWMVTLVMPAWAWLAGSGLKGIYDFFTRRGRGLGAFAVVALLLASLCVCLYTAGDRYVEKRFKHLYDDYSFSREAAEMVNGTVPEDATILVFNKDAFVNPILYYNLRDDIRFYKIDEGLTYPFNAGRLMWYWGDRGANAGLFYPDETGERLARLVHTYRGGELRKTPYGYLLIVP